MPHRHAGHDAADHHHGHGHHNDQGITGALRYIRWLPRMWTSAINDAVVALIDARPGERVVDIGAGMGAGAIRTAATGAQVIAVEPTPFMRRVLAMRRLFSRRRSNIEVVDGAAERIPVDDHSIDAVWAVNTMHHWVDVERGVAEIARVLRPNGRILLVDEVFTDPSHPDHLRFGTDHDDEHHGFTMVDASQMGNLLRSAGLTAVDASNRQIADRPVIAVSAHGVPQTD
jgi:SAM-dependent methyltransferase